MKRGMIKSFKPERGFGFIGVPGKPDLFCHITDREVRKFRAHVSGEPGVLSTTKPSRPFEERMPRPEGGDWVLYKIERCKNGKPKACPWEFADAYDNAKVESLLLSGKDDKPVLETGIIRYYNPNTGWGRLMNENGLVLQFHWDNGRHFSLDYIDPEGIRTPVVTLDRSRPFQHQYASCPSGWSVCASFVISVARSPAGVWMSSD